MSGWWNRIRQLWRKLWRNGAAPVPTLVAPPPLVSPPPPIPVSTKEARDQKIRALELARLRHDKFVKPKGERPKRERVPRPPKPAPPIACDDEPIPVGDAADAKVKDANVYMADEWMEGDGQGNVLFLEEELYGEFNFRDSILDQLDRYWVYLERMRKHDFAAYIMCCKVGATLVPYVASFSNRIHNRKDDLEPVEKYKEGIALPSWFKQHWPAFGCIAIGTNPLDEAQELKIKDDKNKKVLWIVKFMHIQKFSKVPWYVQPVRGGHIYQMTVYWDRPHDPKFKQHKWGVPQEFYIWVADDGSTMRILKTRKNGDSYHPQGHWVLDHDLNIDAEERKFGYTPQLVLSRKFCDMAKMLEQSSYSMCRVEVSKGDRVATFGVDPSRMAYFFRDRDIHLTTDGAVKPIFHIVRPHKRKDGSVVPMHFRGLKQFSWANYNVSITVPGRDHLMLPEFDVGAFMLKPHERRSKKGYLDERQFAERMRDYIKRGVGAYRQ